jgi:hypothetical protein
LLQKGNSNALAYQPTHLLAHLLAVPRVLLNRIETLRGTYGVTHSELSQQKSSTPWAGRLKETSMKAIKGRREWPKFTLAIFSALLPIVH